MVRMGASTKLASAELFQPLRNCNLREGFFFAMPTANPEIDKSDTYQTAFSLQNLNQFASL